MFPSVFLDNSPHHAEEELGDKVKRIAAYLADLRNVDLDILWIGICPQLSLQLKWPSSSWRRTNILNIILLVFKRFRVFRFYLTVRSED